MENKSEIFDKAKQLHQSGKIIDAQKLYLKLIEDNFSYFENTAELDVLDYSIPDFNNNRFISYQDKDFDSVLFSIWEKHPF